ncbi:MAG: hypothetical protein HQK77_11495 [Desulfobacterales bacterium]|nr:hypothetical protein [Desulfobacterales bacterium]
MANSTQLSMFFQTHKTAMMVLVIALLLLELEIFTVSAMKSGRQSTLNVLNAEGVVIYQTDGDHLSDFNKYYFESTFGPLEKYQLKLETNHVPFPFRAWFAAAIGIPIGLFLLFAFLIKGFAALFYHSQQQTNTLAQESNGIPIDQWLKRIQQLNIFFIGFVVLVGVISVWVVPELITYLAAMGMHTLITYKWFFLGILIGTTAIMMWFIYLRYLLAQKAIDAKIEIQKFQLQLQYHVKEKQELLPHTTTIHDTNLNATIWHDTKQV